MANPLYGSNKLDSLIDKVVDSQAAYAMTATDSGDGVSTAEVKEGLIELRVNDLGSGENVTFTVPFDFEIQDVWLIVPNGENVTSKTYTLQNGATAISSAMSGATDKARVVPSTIDSAQCIFRVGENDIKVVSSAHADGNCRIYIKYAIL